MKDITNDLNNRKLDDVINRINARTTLVATPKSVPGINHPDADKDWGHGVTVEQLRPFCKNAMTTMPEVIWKYANIYKVNPALVVAITSFETGWGTSNAIRNHNNPAGVMDWERDWKYLRNFPSLQEGFRYAISNLSRKYIAKGLKTIEQIASKYSPVGAANDPNGTNAQWPGSVHKIFTDITGRRWTAADAGTGVANENLDPVVGGIQGGVAGDGTGEPEINFDNREPDDLKDITGVILCYNAPFHWFKVKDYQDEWRKNERLNNYDRRFHYAIDDSGIYATGDDRKILQSMVDNDTSTYINRALFKNKAINHCISIGAFVNDKVEYEKTEAKLIRGVARILHKYGLQTKDLWREFDLNRAPSHLIYLEITHWKRFLQEVDKQLKHLQSNYALPVKNDYEKNVGKTGKVKSIEKLLKEPKDGGEVVEVLDKDKEVKVKSYSNTWYEIDSPRGWLPVRALEFPRESGDTSTGLPEEEIESVGTNAKVKLPKIDESKMPEVSNIIDTDMYNTLRNYADFTVIENYAQMHEPYDKGLKEVIDAHITDDERLAALTKTVTSKNENNMNYSITEATPGPGDHCKRSPSELNAIWKSEHLRVEPIYPDLIIPPNFSTTDQNLLDENALPPGIFTDKSVIEDVAKDLSKEELKDIKLKMFDYSKVKKDKKSVGKISL